MRTHNVDNRNQTRLSFSRRPTLGGRDWHPEMSRHSRNLAVFLCPAHSYVYGGLGGAPARAAGCDTGMPTSFSPSPYDWHRLEMGFKPVFRSRNHE
ncbi:hypothetical protein [Methylobacter tundripaludum]|uniref:hypothetical protein n=1 Tax=Methylobacter tundripaludum TaxID=173365 RepID=UPI00123773EC|nr:hypothetical protein [Methylobacter tundripaludum]